MVYIYVCKRFKVTMDMVSSKEGDWVSQILKGNIDFTPRLTSKYLKTLKCLTYTVCTLGFATVKITSLKIIFKL